MLDLGVDGAAIDRTSALLALDDPGRGEPQIQTGHTRNHRRIKGESHLSPGAHALPRVSTRQGLTRWFRASDKLALHVRQIPAYSERAIYSRSLWFRRRSFLDTTLELRSDAADCDRPPAPI